MLTLQEIRRMVENPVMKKKVPTAKQLQQEGSVVISRHLGMDAEILVYQSGYAMYRIGKYVTVFSIHSCGDYLYQLSGNILCVQRAFFDQQEWHVRLVLEGEDRVCRNRESAHQEKITSYSTVSEEWWIMADLEKSPLEQLIQEETIEELMNPLTRRQRQVVEQFFLARKTQKEIARELGLTQANISQEISSSIRKIRKYYTINPLSAAIEKVPTRKGGRSHAR